MKNKCPKTYSGKHKFIYQIKKNGATTGSYFIDDKSKPKVCEYCGIINI